MKLGLISRKIKDYYHRDRSKLYITARRDWNIVLIIIFVALLMSFSYNYYVYVDTVVYGERSVLTESVTEKMSDIEKFKKELDEIFFYFENKKQYHEDLFANKKDFMNFVLGGEQASTTKTKKEETTSFLDTFMEKASNGASVWKSVFVDLFE